MLFNASGVLQKYETTNEIFHDFYRVRLEKYEKRREHLLTQIEEKKDKVNDQVGTCNIVYCLYFSIFLSLSQHSFFQYRFVSMVVDGRVQLMGKSRDQIANQLLELGFKPENSETQVTLPLFSPIM